MVSSSFILRRPTEGAVSLSPAKNTTKRVQPQLFSTTTPKHKQFQTIQEINLDLTAQNSTPETVPDCSLRIRGHPRTLNFEL